MSNTMKQLQDKAEELEADLVAIEVYYALGLFTYDKAIELREQRLYELDEVIEKLFKMLDVSDKPT